MTLVHFLAATGALMWALIAWRAYHFMRGLPTRMRWALWPYKRKRTIRRYG